MDPLISIARNLGELAEAMSRIADEQKRSNDMTQAQIDKQDELLKAQGLLHMMPLGGIQ